MRLSIFLILLSLPLAAQEPEAPASKPLESNPVQDLYDLASHYYNEAKGEENPDAKKEAYRLAATKFDRLLRSHPKNTKAIESWYFLALCYRELGEDKASRNCFETTATRWTSGPFVSAASHYLATDDYEQQQWLSASKWFRILATTTDKDKIRHDALYKRFVCFHKLKNDALTIPALNAVLEDKGSPYTERARLTLAQLYQQKNQHRQACELYVALTDSKNKEVKTDAILQAALLSQKLGDKKATKVWFTKSMSDPGSREWHGQSQVALMNLHYQDKEWQSVIDVFKKGDFKLDQKTALQRLIMTAKSHEALGNTKEVSRFEVEISKLSPKTMTGYQASYRALVRSHLTKASDFPRKAEVFLKQYGEEEKLDAKTHSIRLLLANHYYKKKNYRSALDHYQELRLGLIDKSNLLGTRYHLAKSAIALNLEKESLDAIAAFFRGHPGAKQETSLLLNRAEIYSKQGQTDAALKDYETILTKTTYEKLRLNLMQRLSALYQERKDYPKLVDVQEQLLAIPTLDNETKASANFWLGWNEYRLKNHAESLPYLVKARELAPVKFTTQVGPILIRCAFQARDLELLQKEIELLRQSDRNAPLPSAITTWLGANLAKTEQHQKGWAFLKEGISTSKEKIQPVIWRLFAKSSLAAKEPADALKAAEEILKLEESPYRKAEAHFFQSQAYVESQKFEEARQAASDALDLRPQGELDIALRLHAGDIEMAAKKPGEALRHYLIVESLYSKSPEDKKAAAAKVVTCLRAIGTPEALKKLPEFQAKAK